MSGSGTVPRPFPRVGADDRRMVEALGQDLRSMATSDASAMEHTVRLIWTSDHVDNVRRLQEIVEQPARSAAG